MMYKLPKIKRHGKQLLLMLFGITVPSVFVIGSLSDICMVLDDLIERGAYTPEMVNAVFA